MRIGRRFTSTVSPRVVAEMLRDTLAIWWRLRVRHVYGTPPAGQDRSASSTPDPVASPPTTVRRCPDGRRRHNRAVACAGDARLAPLRRRRCRARGPGSGAGRGQGRRPPGAGDGGGALGLRGRVRPAGARDRIGDGRGRGWANLTCTTVPRPAADARWTPARRPRPAGGLAGGRSRGHPDPRPGAAGGWLGRFSSHPSALLSSSGPWSNCAGARRPRSTPSAGARGRGGDLVALLVAVRRHLHDCGLADVADVADEAVAVARRPSDVRPRARGDLAARAVAPAEGILGASGLGADPAVTGADRAPLSPRSAPAPTPTRRRGAPCDRSSPPPNRGPAVATGRLPSPRPHLRPRPAPAADRGRSGQQRARALGGLHRSATGRALLGLLELAAGDWPRRRGHRVALGRAGHGRAPGGRPVPASRWDVVSAAAGVVRGAGQWHERLGRVADRGGPDADDAAALAAFIDDLVRRAAPPGRSWEALSCVGRRPPRPLSAPRRRRTGGPRPRWPPPGRCAASCRRCVTSTGSRPAPI